MTNLSSAARAQRELQERNKNRTAGDIIMSMTYEEWFEKLKK